ncbi:pyridine nucleotide-disulfide oxidoreductase [Ancylostoma ceylanicum]|uniref:Pyridine nucleotide-disulfide oxidoreductase domain-containing protein 1 n=1 Tax=Ancylostoma ceylanicum TaxID=53326 RepID=A0A0D6M7R4_9BILA|nr:pyridine nucleotide-disulfide oxidoreductase [Ancylostoma ceylanicum]
MIYVVVGGGIAGVSCTKRLLESLHQSDDVVLVSASKRVKTVRHWAMVGQYTEQFDVSEDEMASDDPRFRFVQAEVSGWDYKKKVITIRDTESAQELQHRLKGAKRVAVVGNGGIATEVVFEMRGVAITWIIRDDSISSVFFSPAIAEFFQSRMKSGRVEGAKNAGVLKRLRYSLDDSIPKETAHSAAGCALGPDWVSALSFEDTAQLKISANDGGIVVDDSLRTSVADVYACGDVCSTSWSAPSEFWKQMRLWTQARQMGDYCARSMMANGDVDVDFCFELFTHTTTFFGYKVVFLGDFKGERQPPGWYTIERIIKDDQFVQCVMFNHRVVGAVLVGETDLEETIENLILNKTDMERIEDSFLDPEIDIEDYFD